MSSQKTGLAKTFKQHVTRKIALLSCKTLSLMYVFFKSEGMFLLPTSEQLVLSKM